jgi:hypothetical protein
MLNTTTGLIYSQDYSVAIETQGKERNSSEKAFSMTAKKWDVCSGSTDQYVVLSLSFWLTLGWTLSSKIY